jgi:hypothetical protein
LKSNPPTFSCLTNKVNKFFENSSFSVVLKKPLNSKCNVCKLFFYLFFKKLTNINNNKNNNNNIIKVKEINKSIT